MSGKFDSFNIEKCLLNPNNYEADRSCHMDSFYLRKSLQILQG